jgi:hyperosmotically inducible periplasmic protein
MKSFRISALIMILILSVIVTAVAMVASAQQRSVGQVIDDATLTTEIKAKLTADTLSNLTKIGVNTREGVVTLTGDVDSLERKARAVQIASSVRGVRQVVDNVQVLGGPAAPPPPMSSVPGQPTFEVTGIVSQVDPSTGTIILQDGRVLRMTGNTLVWQPTTIQTLRPGTQVLVRGAERLTLGQGGAPGSTAAWPSAAPR